MSEQVHQSMVPVKFNFNGDLLDVVSTGGEHYVVLARLCDVFELKDAWDQQRKLRDLRWARTGVFPVQIGDQVREVACLHIRSVAGWLFTLNPGKIASHLRDKLEQYQQNCAEVLADFFIGRRGATVEIPPEMRAAFEAYPALLQRLIEVEQRLAAAERPTIGSAAARLYILDALKEVARLQAATIRKPHMERALRFKAERRLRVELDFAMTHGMRWSSFPRARLGDAVLAVARILGEARQLAEVATGATQMPLRLVRPAPSTVA